MRLRKHTLDGGDHYPTQVAQGTTNTELINETVALSATDGGYIVTLGDYNGSTATSLKAVAISGMLVEQCLGNLSS